MVPNTPGPQIFLASIYITAFSFYSTQYNLLGTLLFFLCTGTLGILYGCLEIHLDFIKVVRFYLIYL
jgi:hypothetical protein